MLGLPMTDHAAKRCRGRGISPAGIAAALDFGTRRLLRGVEIYTLGWREIGRCAAAGMDLSRFESINVVVAHSGSILTVYRKRRGCRARR